MRGLKLWAGKEFVFAERSRIFYRCVDWNILSSTNVGRTNSRIFYRCVDWNRAYEAIYNAYIRSHLLQMRGLKLWRGEHSNGYYVSHLLQMRGLKQGVVTNINIKTSRMFYRCVDWNNRIKSMMTLSVCRIFYRCVDWNMKLQMLP